MLFRSEAVRLREEVEWLRKADEQWLAEVETLRKNGEDLRGKLKEAVEAHDRTVQAAKEHKVSTQKLVDSLVAEAECVEQAILGMVSPLFLCSLFAAPFLTLLIGCVDFYPEADEEVRKAVAFAIDGMGRQLPSTSRWRWWLGVVLPRHWLW